MNEKAVAVIEKPHGLPAVFERPDDAIREVVAAMRDAFGPAGQLTDTDLVRIKVPAAGGTSWTIPSLEAGDVQASTIRGVVVFQSEAQVYYEKSIEETGGGAPPDCYSADGMVGRGTPGGNCDICPLAKFGPDSERPACRRYKRLFMLTGDSLLPVVVQVPPTSLKPVKQFFIKMIGQALRPHHALIELSLTKQKGAKFPYSQIEMKFVARLDPASAGRVEEYRKLMEVLSPRVPIDVRPEEA